MSIKSFILKRITARPSKWDILLVGLILLRYVFMLVWFLGLWEMLLHWNYIAMKYFQIPLGLFLPSCTMLICLALIILAKNWFIKAFGILALVVAFFNLSINVFFMDMSSPITEAQRVSSPDNTKTVILYNEPAESALDPSGIIIALKEPGQLFFQKALYVNKEQSDLHLTWLDNQHIKVTTEKDLLCVLDIHAPIQMEEY